MILLLALIWLIGNQLSKVESTDLNKVFVKRPFFLILGCVLVVVNWFFEWRKWLITLNVIGVKEEQKVVFKSFMAGIATGLLTPNMLGNFLGRIYYFQRRFRVSIILMTLLSNFTQFFASIFFGFLSLLLLQQLPFESSFFLVLILLGLITLISLVFYFFFEYITLGMITKMKIYQKMLTFIDENKGFRGKFMMLSLIRHFVFTLQFWLIFNSFQEGLNFTVFFWIWQIFLWTTLIPSLWFGKLLIRESVALLVLTSLGYAELEIVFSSVLLWVVNLAFPSILSIFICKRKVERV
jgi:uncharacterized membrane protein YbhN (UPF0104 family)